MKTVSFTRQNKNGEFELLQKVQMEIIPCAGEIVYIKGMRHKVKDVVFNLDIEMDHIDQISILLEIY
jgi:hypothetical protein